MSLKVELIKGLEKIDNIIYNSDLIDNSNRDIFIKLKNDIENFKIYLPLIGNFNAGKSSILNLLLEKDELLPTNIVPETAIATEIIYDKTERVEAFNFESDSIVKTFSSLDILKDEKIKDYGYIKVYKNSSFLSENRDVILVDMPGLDSNIKRHNSQILNYLQKDAVSFIAVVDIDDGTIKGSTLRFIDELNRYKLDFFVLINKVDKKTPSEIEKIKQNIYNELLKYSENPFVGAISTFDNDVRDFKNIFSKINREKYIKVIFIESIIFNIDKIIQDLEVRKSAIQIDTEEIDKKIKNLIDGIYEFEKSLRREKRLIENKFSINVLNSILRDIEDALLKNIDRLITSLNTSDEIFQITLNEIIRPVLIQAFDKNIEKEFTLTIDNLKNSRDDIFVNIPNILDKSQSVINVATDIFKHTPILLKIPLLVNIFKFLVTKVNPVVTALSAIVALVSGFFEKSKEEQEREAYENMKRHIKESVIQEIIYKIRPNVIDVLEEVKEGFFKEIESSINQQKKELVASLNKAKEEKERYKSNIKAKINSFDNTIDILVKEKEKIFGLK
jgi:GTP-binding protein EngB required for normal cell division